MVDWNTGAPNPRFRVLELLKNNFAFGDTLVATTSDSPGIYALGFIGHNGEHKVLLVNKRNHETQVTLPQAGKKVEFIDQTTKSDPPASRSLTGTEYTLGAYGVAVLTFE